MKTAYVFSGQGAQAVGMGRDLYEASPAAKAVFDEADSILGWSVSDVCFNGPAEKLTESRYCQPSIYTTSMACLAYYREQNHGDPDEVVGCAGLSLGEYAALCTAGVFSFADGLRLLEKRAVFMDEECKKTKGGMAGIIGGKPETVAEVCKECDIDIANLNCPGQIVISGVEERVLKACELLKAQGVKRAIPLKVAGAFHSRLMKPAGDRLVEYLNAAVFSNPKYASAQNVTGTVVSEPALLKANLALQVSGSVRWEACVRSLIALGAEKFVEFGPGNVLTGLIRRTEPSVQLVNVNSLNQ